MFSKPPFPKLPFPILLGPAYVPQQSQEITIPHLPSKGPQAHHSLLERMAIDSSFAQKANFTSTQAWAMAQQQAMGQSCNPNPLVEACKYYIGTYGNEPDAIEAFIAYCVTYLPASSGKLAKDFREIKIWLQVLCLGYFDLVFEALNPWMTYLLNGEGNFSDNFNARRWRVLMLGNIVTALLKAGEQS